MTNDYLLFLITFPFNFDYFYITISLTFIRHYHFNLQVGFDSAIKKAHKEVV